MRLKAVTGIALAVLLVGMLTLAFNIQPAESSQPPPTEWTRTYGGASIDWAKSVVETSDGGYVLAGTTFSFGAGHGDFWLVKVGFAAKVFHVVVDSTSYIVTISSNSTITDFKQQDKQISFNVTGESGTNGYCNVTIPESLLKGSPWTIKIDDTPIADFDEKTNNTHLPILHLYA